MKHTWTRTQPALSLSHTELTHILARAHIHHPISHTRRITSGLVNTLYRVDLSSHRPLCLKFGQRGPRPAALEAEIARTLGPHFPIPPVLAFFPDVPVLITEWAPGQRLDTLAPHLPDPHTLIPRLARTLVALHSHPCPSTGLLDANLDVAQPFRLDANGLLSYARTTLLEGPGEARIGSPLTSRLLDHLERRAPQLDPHSHDACLCHGDMGPENILCTEDGTLTLIDWEFACAATPFLDLGHLLRTPLTPDFEHHLASAYRDAGGTLPDHWPELARLTDLFAWLSFLAREHLGDDVTSAATRHIERLISTL